MKGFNLATLIAATLMSTLRVAMGDNTQRIARPRSPASPKRKVINAMFTGVDQPDSYFDSGKPVGKRKARRDRAKAKRLK